MRKTFPMLLTFASVLAILTVMGPSAKADECYAECFNEGIACFNECHEGDESCYNQCDCYVHACLARCDRESEISCD